MAIMMWLDSIGSGAASNLSSPGVLQQQRASLVEAVGSDLAAVCIGQSGWYLLLPYRPELHNLCYSFTFRLRDHGYETNRGDTC